MIKIKKNKKLIEIFKWMLAIILLILSFKYTPLSCLTVNSISPIKTLQKFEKLHHYGPSKIVKTIDLTDGKLYLCRYKEWFSADYIEKNIFTWCEEDGIEGVKIDKSQRVTYSWSYTDNPKTNNERIIICGYVSDPNIKAITMNIPSKKTTLKYKLNKDRLFIFYLNNQSEKLYSCYFPLEGLDKNNKIIYKNET